VQINTQDLIFHCQDDCFSACQEDLEDAYICEEICPTGAIACSFDIVIDTGPAPPQGKSTPNKENKQG
jgi:hypothetical protein